MQVALWTANMEADCISPTHLRIISANCSASVSAASHNDEAAAMQDSRLGNKAIEPQKHGNQAITLCLLEVGVPSPNGFLTSRLGESLIPSPFRGNGVLSVNTISSPPINSDTILSSTNLLLP
jgi:hypothetical protein